MAANFSRDKKGTERALSQWEEKWQGHGPWNLQQQELPERNADQHLQPLLHGICKKQKLNFHANKVLCIARVSKPCFRYQKSEPIFDLPHLTCRFVTGEKEEEKEVRKKSGLVVVTPEINCG